MQIIIYGNSIAAFMATLALNESVGKEFELYLIMPEHQSASDILLGGQTSPNAYNFNLSLGISEPELLLNSNSSFSFGTHYQAWTHHKLDWLQSYNLPFPVLQGVELHQLLVKSEQPLQVYSIGAQAALHGRFAHPPQDKPELPLSRAEYGYHFDHQSFAELLLSKIKKSNVKLTTASIEKVKLASNGIKSVLLDSGQEHAADFFIDASGCDAELLSKLNAKSIPSFNSTARQYFRWSSQAIREPQGPCSKIQGDRAQWVLETPLQNKNCILSASNNQFENSLPVNLGMREQAWVDNCLAIGHAAAVISPHTTAPYRLLINDIQRLLELIPVNKNMSMESQEYNRRFQQDFIHASVFSEALFDTRQMLGPQSQPSPEFCEEMDTMSQIKALLNRKVEQFLNRALLVSYDLEPFNKEDWTILHMGMQRKPQQCDSLVHGLAEENYKAELSAMKTTIIALVHKLPPAHIYTQKFIEYLKKKS